MISLLTINVRGVSNKHCLLPFFIFTDINTLNFLSLTQVDQRNEKFFYPAFKGPFFLSLQLKTPIKPQERTMSCTKMRQNKLEGGAT